MSHQRSIVPFDIQALSETTKPSGEKETISQKGLRVPHEDSQTQLCLEADRSRLKTAYETFRKRIRGGSADVQAVDTDDRIPPHNAAQSDLGNANSAIHNLTHGASADVKAANRDDRKSVPETARLDAIHKLVRGGSADVKTVDKDGWTPLHEAARSGSAHAESTIAKLIRQGADVKAADKDGRTPLHEAARSGSVNAFYAISELVSKGADVKVADKDGRTPLHEAALSGTWHARYAVAEFIQGGADVKAADKDGRTPLHEAARSGSANTESVIAELIRQGADVKAADKDGRTPLHEVAQLELANARYAVAGFTKGGVDFKAADSKTSSKDGARPSLGASITGLGNIIRVLGSRVTSSEPAAAMASRSDREDDAMLMLQLGVDPITVSKDWRSRHSTRAEEEMPAHLRLWENSATEHDYGTIRELVDEITADHCVVFDSITWEWELPAVLASDLGAEVVLVCTRPRTTLLGDFGQFYALTYQEYLEKSEWANFIMETLDILAAAQLNPQHAGMS
ncbi:hypothetical protein N0V94_003977 [Neodidymelliopsis sp. IMI 364377]|nr:hypothetical protein N0V94_003977 [Neodidymelliopsis sp. IMI 364377]